jgi:uncharacterized protein YgbK (DUF1537 family)
LFGGRHTGTDLTGSDGVFGILIVRGVRAVVVVTSGTATGGDSQEVVESADEARKMLSWSAGEHARG